jgi:hypothetical protein
MPVNPEQARVTWLRYVYCRDNGHIDYVKKARQCEDFFAGDQWDPMDKAYLQSVKRPALTINKILSTVSNVLGEQIQTRNEISFRPRGPGADSQVADTLTKVFSQISDNNQLDWLRSDMFADGIITSRGYLDIRMNYDDNEQGEVKIIKLNPKNVLVDPDADDYDPKTWNDVLISRWMTADDIAILYSKEDAEYLRHKSGELYTYGYDAVDVRRDSFAQAVVRGYPGAPMDGTVPVRNIRVIERQYKLLDNVKHFVDLTTGDMRPIPDDWNRDKITAIADQYRLGVKKKLIKRVKWEVVADNVLLHESWSPYTDFTVVPYFPYFRHGRTIGMVENLLGPQELLNKVSSQELHVVNTSANSGWVVKTGSLVNMSIEELEQRGAQTGLVLEVRDDTAHVQKINPNQTPTGLDRITYKAEEHIKTISGVSDSAQGFDREDVAAKAIQAKQMRGAINQAKCMDSLSRTDFLIARQILNLVQEFYTGPRVMQIMTDRLTRETQQLDLNTPDPVTGAITNDLTLGEYDVVVSSMPSRDSLEDSQFEQAARMREMGINIPETVLVENSRLLRRGEIMKQMQEAQNSPEAQAQAQLQQQMQQAELAKTQAEAQNKQADAGLKQAKAQELQMPDQSEQVKVEAEQMKMQLEQQKHEMDIEAEQVKQQQSMQAEAAKMSMADQKLQAELEMKKQMHALELEMKQQEIAMKKQEAEQNAQIKWAESQVKMLTANKESSENE